MPRHNNANSQPGGDHKFVGETSTAKYVSQSRLDLDGGVATVNTETGAAVHLPMYTVTAVIWPAEYQVSRTKVGGRVWFRKGEVRIDGKKLDVPKDNIAELDRDCKVGPYLRTPWYVGQIHDTGINRGTLRANHLLLPMPSE
jgi:hypothetical protein